MVFKYWYAMYTCAPIKRADSVDYVALGSLL